MIFDMVIYVTLLNLTEMECILLLLKSCLFLCLCVLESKDSKTHKQRNRLWTNQNDISWR